MSDFASLSEHLAFNDSRISFFQRGEQDVDTAYQPRRREGNYQYPSFRAGHRSRRVDPKDAANSKQSALRSDICVVISGLHATGAIQRDSDSFWIL